MDISNLSQAFQSFLSRSRSAASTNNSNAHSTPAGSAPQDAFSSSPQWSDFVQQEMDRARQERSASGGAPGGLPDFGPRGGREVAGAISEFASAMAANAKAGRTLANGSTTSPTLDSVRAFGDLAPSSDLGEIFSYTMANAALSAPAAKAMNDLAKDLSRIAGKYGVELSDEELQGFVGDLASSIDHDINKALEQMDYKTPVTTEDFKAYEEVMGSVRDTAMVNALASTNSLELLEDLAVAKDMSLPELLALGSDDNDSQSDLSLGGFPGHGTDLDAAQNSPGYVESNREELGLSSSSADGSETDSEDGLEVAP